MSHKILEYNISWATAQRKGYITLIANDSSGKPSMRFSLNPETPDEFLCFMNILQNKNPVYWNDNSKTLKTRFKSNQ